jgi:hypothetical protein
LRRAARSGPKNNRAKTSRSPRSSSFREYGCEPAIAATFALEAGGNPYHSGGRQFATKNDPEWKILAEWVNGQKAPAK